MEMLLLICTQHTRGWPGLYWANHMEFTDSISGLSYQEPWERCHNESGFSLMQSDYLPSGILVHGGPLASLGNLSFALKNLKLRSD